MKNVLILGASGQIAQWVVKSIGEATDINQTLLVRDPKKLTGQEPNHSKVVIGNVLNNGLLKDAVQGQDIVYANLI